MSSSRARIGRAAETLAASELTSRGYHILTSNYRCSYGEIDIIATDGDCLVFVEVRYRSSNAFGTPAESITHLKQQRLIVTAQHYLYEFEIGDCECRFDVVEVTSAGGRMSVIDIIKNAFSA